MTVVGGSAPTDAAAEAGQSRRRRRAALPGHRPGLRPEDSGGNNGGRDASDVLWDVEGVAAYLHVPKGAIYKMTARNAPCRIPHIRLGGKLRFRRRDIEHWLTLLTDSNIKTLERVRRLASKETHGNDSQTTVGEW